jgi:hypothetical protein
VDLREGERVLDLGSGGGIGALSRAEYLAGLAAAGFADAPVTFTTQAARARTRPSGAPSSRSAPPYLSSSTRMLPMRAATTMTTSSRTG